LGVPLESPVAAGVVAVAIVAAPVAIRSDGSAMEAVAHATLGHAPRPNAEPLPGVAVNRGDRSRFATREELGLD